MNLLKFSNPTFVDGVNLTVRLGTKWDGIRNTNVDLGNGYYTYVTNIHSKVLKFNELTDSDLIHEHDPSCKTVDGLAKVMQDLYPDFTTESEITLLHFIMNFKTPIIGELVYKFDIIPIYVGTINSLKKLDNDFWEVNYARKNFYTKEAESGTAIIHETQWYVNIGGLNNSGWHNAKN